VPRERREKGERPGASKGRREEGGRERERRGLGERASEKVTVRADGGRGRELERASELERARARTGEGGGSDVGASESNALVTERRTDGRTPLPLRSCSGRPPVGRALPSKVDGFANALPLRKKKVLPATPYEKKRE